MKLLIPLLAVILISACGSRSVRPATPTPDMVQDFSVTYTNCPAAYIPQLDDGQSDALTIAQGLDGFCLSEFDQFINYSTRADKPAVRVAALHKARMNKTPIILPIVLRVRNSRLPGPAPQQTDNSLSAKNRPGPPPRRVVATTSGPTCHTGPRGGTYTITSSGRKNYGGC